MISDLLAFIGAHPFFKDAVQIIAALCTTIGGLYATYRWLFRMSPEESARRAKVADFRAQFLRLKDLHDRHTESFARTKDSDEISKAADAARGAIDMYESYSSFFATEQKSSLDVRLSQIRKIGLSDPQKSTQGIFDFIRAVADALDFCTPTETQTLACRLG